MAIQGNAFALLDDDDAENLLARVSTAAVEPPSAEDKRKAKNKKPPPSSHSSSQSSTAAPQRSSDHEKGRQGSEGYNRNCFVRQTRTIGKGYNNRDGVERHNRNGVEANGGEENGSRQNSRDGVVFKRNNGCRHDEMPAADGLRRHEGNSNGYYYQKKQETANGHQKKQETTNGCTDGHQKKEDINNDGWQIVRRPNGHKQNNVNHWEAPREGNVGGRERHYVGRREFNNGNGSEAKVLEDNQHQDESWEKGVSAGIVEKSTDNAGKDENEYRIRNGVNGRAKRGGYGRGGERGGNRVSYQQRRPESAVEGEENGKSSEPTELVTEKESQKGSGDANAGPEGDETASKSSSKGKHDKVPSQREIERIERMAELELDAKRMTLKQYEKQLEEKRKVLESLKTEERKVTLDKELESMHIIERKNEETNTVKLNSAGDKLKKKVANNKGDNNAPTVKNYLFRPPSGGRYPRRDDNRNGASEGAGNEPDAVRVVEKPAIPPPSFEDVNQFPALALDGSAKAK